MSKMNLAIFLLNFCSYNFSDAFSNLPDAVTKQFLMLWYYNTLAINSFLIFTLITLIDLCPKENLVFSHFSFTFFINL